MDFIIHKFTKGSDMMLEPFLGTEATARACMLDPWHCNFTGWDTDREHVVKMIPLLLHIFAKQVLNPESGIKKSWEDQRVAKQYLAEQKVVSVVHTVHHRTSDFPDTLPVRQSVLKMSRNLYPVQVLQEHIPIFLSEYYMDMEIFEKAMHVIYTH